MQHTGCVRYSRVSSSKLGKVVGSLSVSCAAVVDFFFLLVDCIKK